MSTLHLLRPSSLSRPQRLPRSGALHRCWLRLRSRWLGWRGMAVLQAVAGADGMSMPAAAAGQERRRHEQGLLELNLLLERARAKHDAHHGKPGGMAR